MRLAITAIILAIIMTMATSIDTTDTGSLVNFQDGTGYYIEHSK